jgi:GTPase
MPFTVAIVGRPNVGKSSLFNALAGERIAITDATPGTTRDRLLRNIRWDGKSFDIVDTGGIGIVDRQDLSAEIEEQIDAAIAQADLLLFIVDAHDGVTPEDRRVAERLRRLGKPVVAAANKADNDVLAAVAGEFAALGLGEFTPFSASHRRNLDIIRDRIVSHIGAAAGPEAPDEAIKVAVVGRRNVGKSTFVNTLCDARRVIVSDVSGTTRDAVDVRLERGKSRFILIDTAGLRKRGQVDASVDFYAAQRTEESIRRADVVLFMIDCIEGLSTVDRKLAVFIDECYRPALIAVNKWDLAGAVTTGKYDAYLRKRLPQFDHAPRAFICARSGAQVLQAMSVVRELYEQSGVHVPTARLNAILKAAVERHSPPLPRSGTHKPRMFYAVQTGVRPPTVTIFVNRPPMFKEPYMRYLTSFFRESMRAAEIPVKIILRPRGSKKKDVVSERRSAAD